MGGIREAGPGVGVGKGALRMFGLCDEVGV